MLDVRETVRNDSPALWELTVLAEEPEEQTGDFDLAASGPSGSSWRGRCGWWDPRGKAQLRQGREARTVPFCCIVKTAAG